MTAEERAASLVFTCLGASLHSVWVGTRPVLHNMPQEPAERVVELLRHDLATALREHERETLERAAAECEHVAIDAAVRAVEAGATMYGSVHERGEEAGANACARAIRGMAREVR